VPGKGGEKREKKKKRVTKGGGGKGGKEKGKGQGGQLPFFLIVGVNDLPERERRKKEKGRGCAHAKGGERKRKRKEKKPHHTPPPPPPFYGKKKGKGGKGFEERKRGGDKRDQRKVQRLFLAVVKISLCPICHYSMLIPGVLFIWKRGEGEERIGKVRIGHSHYFSSLFLQLVQRPGEKRKWGKKKRNVGGKRGGGGSGQGIA